MASLQQHSMGWANGWEWGGSGAAGVRAAKESEERLFGLRAKGAGGILDGTSAGQLLLLRRHLHYLSPQHT
jgi:hypothetical protein